MSDTITLPDGHTATISDSGMVTERRRRVIRRIANRLGPTLKAVVDARVITGPDGKALTLEEATEASKENIEALELTPEDLEMLDDMQNATTWAHLESWTLDLPLPATPEDLLDLPGNVYDVLSREVAKRTAASVLEQFGLAGVEDETSPTGASGD